MIEVYKKLDLPIYDNLLEELTKLVVWDDYNQICLNTVPGHEDNHQYGQGSLYYDWDNSREEWDESEKRYKWVVPPRKIALHEHNFTKTCDIFRGTVFEELLTELKSNYNVGRVRVMKMSPKTCLTWHVDDSRRIHYPFKTNDGCKMVIGETVFNMHEHNWYWTDTLQPHTAFNASKEPRLHIVACLIEDDYI